MARPNLSAQRLRELLDYDPKTGVFTNRVRRSPKAMPGCIAGTKKKSDGRLYICIDGNKDVLQSRLAWLYMTGHWPSKDVDHIDGDHGNNAFVNLRDVSEKVNLQNQRNAHEDNATGYLGVSAHYVKQGNGSKVKKYRARIYIDGKNTNVGVFATPEAAHAAYLNVKREFHPGCTI